MDQLYMAHLSPCNGKQRRVRASGYCQYPCTPLCRLWFPLVIHWIHDSPRGLSQVSHSLYLVTCSATVNTTTRRRNDTASHPRRHAMPRTLSRNSNSATSLPMASSHKMTLLGGYKGLGPPPTKKRRDDVWHGTTNCNVPPESSNIIESPGYIEAK